jgi:hypothetical protein
MQVKNLWRKLGAILDNVGTTLCLIDSNLYGVARMISIPATFPVIHR